jgi:hypothetical protein
MLQRIQTIFLAMIPLTLAIMQVLPIWSKVEPITLHSYTLYAWKLQELCAAKELLATSFFPYVAVGILAVLVSVVAIYEILRYDNRVLQLQIGAINSILLTSLLGTIVYLAVQNQEAYLPGVVGNYRAGFVMPILSVIGNLLANHFIRRDERLVQSANRIR